MTRAREGGTTGRTPPEDRGGAGRTPEAANTARDGAGLRARQPNGIRGLSVEGMELETRVQEPRQNR